MIFLLLSPSSGGDSHGPFFLMFVGPPVQVDVDHGRHWQFGQKPGQTQHLLENFNAIDDVCFLNFVTVG